MMLNNICDSWIEYWNVIICNTHIILQQTKNYPIENFRCGDVQILSYTSGSGGGGGDVLHLYNIFKFLWACTSVWKYILNRNACKST